MKQKIDWKSEWIVKSHKYLPHVDSQERDKVISFWVEFYDEVSKKAANAASDFTILRDNLYKQTVFKRLDENRGKDLSIDELRELQMFIERETFEFDEKSMYKSTPSIINYLIKKDAESAKDYLLRSKKIDVLSSQLLNEFDQYTLEAILVHVLSTLFNAVESTAVIRLSTLIDRIESAVRSQAIVLKSRRLYKIGAIMSSEEKVSINKRRDFRFGIELVEFMQKRKL